MNLPITPPTTPTVPATPPAPEMPAYFQAFVDKVEGQFKQIGQDFGRIRDKLPGKQSEPAAPSENKPSVGLDVMSTVKLGRLMEKLPASVQARVEAKLEKGVDISSVYEYASDVFESLSGANPGTNKLPNAGDRPPVAPIGEPASGEPRTQPMHPRSKAEFFALKASDPARYKLLMADNSFDPNILPLNFRG